MPIDSNIALQYRPFRIDDPLDKYAKYMGVAAAQRQFTMEDSISEAARASGGDPEKMSRVLMERGQFAPAMQLRTQANAMQKAEVEQKLKLAEAAGSDAMMLDHLYRQAVQESGGDQAAAIAKVQPTHTQLRQKWLGLGIKDVPEQFNPQVNFGWIGSAKEAAQHLKNLAPNIQMTDTGGQIVPTNTNPLAGPIGAVPGAASIAKTAKPGEPTELARLQAERDALPEGDPRRATYDRVLAHYKAGKGDTNVTVNSGPMTPGKAGGNKIDEGILDITRNLMQLDTITGQFKPEYQRFQDKAGFMALKIKDSTIGLNNKEKKDLTDYSTYRRNAFNTLNEYIKSVTGAAMSEAEAERIRKAMPDPGDGLFGGDSPTEFKAKLDDALKQTRMAVSRLSYIKRNGMSLDDGKGNPIIPLERMPALMNEQGKKLEAQFKQENPGADAKAINKAVRRQLSVEFGLSAD